MAPLAIDLDIGSTLQAIDGILARREAEHATVWDSLAYQLEAVSFAVGNLDRMYFSILAEIGNVFVEPEPPPQRIDDVIAQATAYCTDGRLALRLDDWREQSRARPSTAPCSTAAIARSPRYCAALMIHWEDTSSASTTCNTEVATTRTPLCTQCCPVLSSPSRPTDGGTSGQSWNW